MEYQVVSHRLGLSEGSLVSETDLQECNIEALVESGHLMVVASKLAKQQKTQIEEIL